MGVCQYCLYVLLRIKAMPGGYANAICICFTHKMLTWGGLPFDFGLQQ